MINTQLTEFAATLSNELASQRNGATDLLAQAASENKLLRAYAEKLQARIAELEQKQQPEPVPGESG